MEEPVVDRSMPDETAQQTGRHPEMCEEIVFVGEFGTDKYTGPFSMEVEEGMVTIRVPLGDDAKALSAMREDSLMRRDGKFAIVVADGKADTGGEAVEIWKPEQEGEIHVVLDEYPKGS